MPDLADLISTQFKKFGYSPEITDHTAPNDGGEPYTVITGHNDGFQIIAGYGSSRLIIGYKIWDNSPRQLAEYNYCDPEFDLAAALAIAHAQTVTAATP